MTKKVAGVALYRPYWKGYDHQKDKNLVDQLFLGRTVRDAAGKPLIKYFSKDSPQERLAREALTRLLMYSTKDADDLDIIALLCCALRADGGSERRIVFQFRKRGGRRSNKAGDLSVYLHVSG